MSINRLNLSEWIRTVIVVASFAGGLLWQLSELKTEFKIRLAQLEQLVKIYQDNDADNDRRISVLEVHLARVEERIKNMR